MLSLIVQVESGEIPPHCKSKIRLICKASVFQMILPCVKLYSKMSAQVLVYECLQL